jgi:hypothetical protein
LRLSKQRLNLKDTSSLGTASDFQGMSRHLSLLPFDLALAALLYPPITSTFGQADVSCFIARYMDV